MNPVVTALVSGVVGGGLFGGIGSFLVNRSIAHKTAHETRAADLKLPAEMDSLTVQGAEQAVLTMKAALESAAGRITQLEAERASDRQRIVDLEAKVRDLQRQVESANRSVTEAHRRGQEIQAELAAFRQDQARRR